MFGAAILVPVLGGLGCIIKMLYSMDSKIDKHGSRLDAIGLELHRAESELRADHQELKNQVTKNLDDHESRIRELERIRLSRASGDG